jgi:phage shock protein PspC (stress-responsive transcriptional regulator)
MFMEQKLTKSKKKIIAGVCGGIAEWIGWDPTLVRILYVLLSVISAGFPGTIVYIVLWIIMPNPDEPEVMSQS